MLKDLTVWYVTKSSHSQILCLLCPFLIPYRLGTKKEENQEQVEKLESCRIQWGSHTILKTYYLYETLLKENKTLSQN